MARINIEEEAHKRITKLSDYVGCSRREALGTVGYLWGESQELLKIEGSREEIVDWAGIYNLSEPEIDKWLSSLERARFLSKMPGGLYKIHGNETQIEARISRLNRSAKGAETTKKKWQELQSIGQKQGLKQALTLVEAGVNTGIPMQCNSDQCNSDQEKNNSIFDLKSLASEYPNKIGIAEGLRRLKPQISGKQDFEDFHTATQNYNRFLGLEKNKGWLKAKQFDVFVGPKSKDVKPWREWINPDPSVFEDQTKSGFKVTRANLEELA